MPVGVAWNPGFQYKFDEFAAACEPTKVKIVGHFDMHDQPVIIGSSLTGLLISHSLSQNGIEHHLIGGDRPLVTPRLGESMNEGAGLACWRLLDPKFRKHFHSKSHISLMNGDFASMLLVASPNRCLLKLANRLGNRNRPASLWSILNGLCHLDRTEFDPEFYDEVVSNPFCNFVNQPKAKVHFNTDSDLVTQIEVGQNNILHPNYVFDATGFKGVVASAAAVGLEPLTEFERVAWTHLIAEEQPNPKQHWMLNGTNLLKLDQTNDGMDGIAWIIPLGKRISLGISVESTDPFSGAHTKQQLIEFLIQALARRGVDIRSLFPNQDETFEIKHRYYKRERAYGANWLLAGGTFMQYWFPTSSGVGNSALAATLAPELIKDPQQFGKIYQDKLEREITFHNLVERMVKGSSFARFEQAYDFWAEWTAGALRRNHSDLRIANREYNSRNFFRYHWLKNLSMAFDRYPWLEVSTLGSFFTSVDLRRHQNELSSSFLRYHKPLRFILGNAALVLPRYVISKIARHVTNREQSTSTAQTTPESSALGTERHAA